MYNDPQNENRETEKNNIEFSGDFRQEPAGTTEGGGPAQGRENTGSRTDTERGAPVPRFSYTPQKNLYGAEDIKSPADSGVADRPYPTYSPQSPVGDPSTGFGKPSHTYYSGRGPYYGAAAEDENESGFYGTGILPPSVTAHKAVRSGRRRGAAIAVTAVAMVLLLAGAFVSGGFLLNFSDRQSGGEETLPPWSQFSPQPSFPEDTPGVILPTPTGGGLGEKPLQGKGGGNVELHINGTPEPTPREVLDGVLTIPEIVRKVRPSVVGVVAEIANSYGSTSGGSGIIMDESGYILTNCHVIDMAYKITVILDNGERYDAELIGKDERNDLAVLKITAEGLEPAEFGDSDVLEVGELAVAIGTPMSLELQSTVTVGYISAINRVITYDDREVTMIQTDAAINFGNSGGPLINQFGQVIGINTMKYVGIDRMAEGLGFAIPISDAKPVIDELIKVGYIKGRPAIGISGYTLDEATAVANNLPRGVYIAEVNPHGGAHGKLQVGDVIVAVDGTAVTDMDGVNKAKEKFAVGDEITISVYRKGELKDVKIVLFDSAEIERAGG